MFFNFESSNYFKQMTQLFELDLEWKLVANIRERKRDRKTSDATTTLTTTIIVTTTTTATTTLTTATTLTTTRFLHQQH